MAYNKRLKEQMWKQIFFACDGCVPNIKTPTVFGYGYVGDFFYFDMEYVKGVSAIEYVLNANREQLLDFVSILCTIIESNKNHNLDFVVSVEEASIKKILEVKNLVDRPEVLDRVLGLLNHNHRLLATFCHGDLTMENIIYNKESNIVYLIDFLDSYLDHYWLDISKLFQDIDGEWYTVHNRHIDKKYIELKMYFLSNRIWKYLIACEYDYSLMHYALLAVTFSRILPYADREILDFLYNKIDIFIGKHMRNI